MNAGCHVLAEKPLAMTAEDVDAMYELADKNHVKLCVVHQNLFNPVVEEARNLYKSGALGDLVSVDAAALVRRDNYMCLNSKHWCHRLPGGLNFEVLPHPVYLLQAFLENPVPVCVAAKQLGNYEWIKADEIKVLIEANNGVGLIVSSCNSAYHGDTLNILGTKLGLQVDLWGRTVIKYRPKTEDPKSVGKSNVYLAAQFYKPLASNLSNLFKMAFGGVKVSAHYDFILEFVMSILEDRPMPVSRQEARDNVKITEDICAMIDQRVSKAQ
jgi:predicted dehydrogenase